MAVKFFVSFTGYLEEIYCLRQLMKVDDNVWMTKANQDWVTLARVAQTGRVKRFQSKICSFDSSLKDSPTESLTFLWLDCKGDKKVLSQL